ncbi:MAG: hypothetical protein IPK97_07390 [Ahniella sp.]|nr:hypothetical protein [Ahniella sp.]
MTMLRVTFLALLTLLLGACTHAQQVREREAADLAEFERFAGEPIDSFRYVRGLDHWRSFDDENLVIWTNGRKAYLLKLREPCLDLHHQMNIAVLGSYNVVDNKFGYVKFGRERCRIKEIRPVDDMARKMARREAKAG